MISLRPASADESRQVARLYLAAFRAAYRHFLSSEFFDAMDVQEWTGRWAERLSAGSESSFRRTVVAETESELVGLAYCDVNRDSEGPEVAELIALYLMPMYWGRGIGQELLAAVDRHLILAGAHTALLWVFRDNVRARSAYQRAGWTLDSGTETEPTIQHGAAIVRYWRRY